MITSWAELPDVELSKVQQIEQLRWQMRMNNKIYNLPHDIMPHLLMSPCLSCKSAQRGIIMTMEGEMLVGGREKNYRKADNNVAQLDKGGGVCVKGKLMRSASIRRKICQKKKYSNSVDVCKEGREQKRRFQLSVWQTWLEDRKGVRDNPWETAWWTRCPISALLLPPCVLCHGYQTGLPMQPVNVFFSGRSERGTNVSRSVSYTINVNCPGMHKHKEGGWARNTRTAWM